MCNIILTFLFTVLGWPSKTINQVSFLTAFTVCHSTGSTGMPLSIVGYFSLQNLSIIFSVTSKIYKYTEGTNIPKTWKWFGLCHFWGISKLGVILLKVINYTSVIGRFWTSFRVKFIPLFCIIFTAYMCLYLILMQFLYW